MKQNEQTVEEKMSEYLRRHRVGGMRGLHNRAALAYEKHGDTKNAERARRLAQRCRA